MSAGYEGVAVIGTQHPHQIREQRLELGDRAGRIPGLPPPAGQIMAGGEGDGVIGTQHPHQIREQRLEFGSRAGRVPGHSPPAGQISAGYEGYAVIGTQHPHQIREQRLELGDRAGRIPGLPPPAGQTVAGGEGVAVIGAEGGGEGGSQLSQRSRLSAGRGVLRDCRNRIAASGSPAARWHCQVEQSDRDLRRCVLVNPPGHM